MSLDSDSSVCVPEVLSRVAASADWVRLKAADGSWGGDRARKSSGSWYSVSNAMKSGRMEWRGD